MTKVTTCKCGSTFMTLSVCSTCSIVECYWIVLYLVVYPAARKLSLITGTDEYNVIKAQYKAVANKEAPVMVCR